MSVSPVFVGLVALLAADIFINMKQNATDKKLLAQITALANKADKLAEENDSLARNTQSPEKAEATAEVSSTPYVQPSTYTMIITPAAFVAAMYYLYLHSNREPVSGGLVLLVVVALIAAALDYAERVAWSKNLLTNVINKNPTNVATLKAFQLDEVSVVVGVVALIVFINGIFFKPGFAP